MCIEGFSRKIRRQQQFGRHRHRWVDIIKAVLTRSSLWTGFHCLKMEFSVNTVSTFQFP
jgi:hypothetical protein